MDTLLTLTAHGFLFSADNVSYVMERVGEMLKVTGPDTCYYILETAKGLEKADCTLSTFSILIGN
jgi:hypothetical protein